MGEIHEIRLLLRNGDYDKAQKRLFKLYNSELKNIDDVYFTLFNLSLLMKKQNKMHLAKIYINELKERMLVIEDEDKYISQTTSTLWLYIDIYENELSLDETLDTYYLIYNKMLYLGEDDEKVLGVKITIDILKEKYDEALKTFHLCLERQYIDTIKNTLEELHTKDINIYEKAIKIKEEFEKAINVM